MIRRRNCTEVAHESQTARQLFEEAYRTHDNREEAYNARDVDTGQLKKRVER